MKIGELVRRSVPAILRYCERDAGEFGRLQDPTFSKQTFDINYPFCKPVSAIGAADQHRFWKQQYTVGGALVRVTSQWFNPPTSKSLPLLRQYLQERLLPVDTENDPEPLPAIEPTARAARGRYKGNAIGNAQNYLVRNILSRLGDEQFGASHWQAVVAEFEGRCAYCGAEGDLVMDHVVPINKQALGEHRLGNLVPACRACNASKADRDYRDFLAHDPARMAVIAVHLAKHGYAPSGDQRKLRQIIDLAHEDLRQLADRYVMIINTVLNTDPD